MSYINLILIEVNGFEFEVKYEYTPEEPDTWYTPGHGPEAEIIAIYTTKEIDGRKTKIDITKEIEAVNDCEEFLEEIMRYEAEVEYEY
ncbi:MAG: hypothetical protein K0B15_07270 [Lentimicrobium sp.]|nr:hypothetical protein [Lentimicrobium sp.]